MQGPDKDESFPLKHYKKLCFLKNYYKPQYNSWWLHLLWCFWRCLQFYIWC